MSIYNFINPFRYKEAEQNGIQLQKLASVGDKVNKELSSLSDSSCNQLLMMHLLHSLVQWQS